MADEFYVHIVGRPDVFVGGFGSVSAGVQWAWKVLGRDAINWGVVYVTTAVKMGMCLALTPGQYVERMKQNTLQAVD